MTVRGLVARARRRRVAVVSFLGVVVVAGAAPHAWGWYHLRAGKAALEQYHPAAARDELAAALRVWPDRPGVRLLASRAARQAGDFAAAEHQLRAARRAAGEATDELAFEWALAQAAGGNVWEVEEYLQRRVEESPALAPLAWEALAEGYLRLYRTIDAMACLDHWLQRDPDNVRALELRGMTLVTGKGVHRGAADYRRALELDPSRDDVRWRLALCLLDLGGYEEALGQLDRVAIARPADPAVQVRQARCLNMLGRADDARRLLDAVLAAHPGDPVALRTRGQFALSQRQPAEAEDWLRRAAAADPNDYQSQWLLFQALQQQGRGDAARDQLEIADRVKDLSERLGELRSRKLAERPLDPALHAEMGVLLIRTGQVNAGEWWLRSALSLDPDYGPARAALAALYDRTADTAAADRSPQPAPRTDR